MARRKKEDEGRNWTEAEVVLQFKLKRIATYQTPLIQEWLEVENPVFNDFEQTLFDIIYLKGLENMTGWSEEDLRNEVYYAYLGFGAFERRKLRSRLF